MLASHAKLFYQYISKEMPCGCKNKKSKSLREKKLEKKYGEKPRDPKTLKELDIKPEIQASRTIGTISGFLRNESDVRR